MVFTKDRQAYGIPTEAAASFEDILAVEAAELADVLDFPSPQMQQFGLDVAAIYLKVSEAATNCAHSL